MSLIDVTFTGTANGIHPTIDPITHQENLNSFRGKSFTAEFVFNTDLGTMHDTATGHELDGGLVSASIDLGDLGVWGIRPNNTLDLLQWNDDLSMVLANAGTGYFHLEVQNFLFDSDQQAGGFQFGLCPTTVGGPCGYMSIAPSVDISGLPVPAPIAGAGPSSLALVVLAAWFYTRLKVVRVNNH